MGHKIIGVAAGILLLSLAAVGAFASQDAVQTEQEDDTPTVTATLTPDAGDVEADDADADEEGADGEGREGPRGIPDDNPSHEPNDDDVCEKHETEIKTMPSGNEVVVPCHVVEEHENAAGADVGADDELSAGEAEDADKDKHDDEDEDGAEEEDDEGDELAGG